MGRHISWIFNRRFQPRHALSLTNAYAASTATCPVSPAPLPPSGMLVDLSNKLGAPLGRDVDSMRKNLASVVGKSGGYSPAPAASSSGSSWRTPAAAAPAASSGGDRWASYSRSSGGSSAGSAGGASGGNVSERELSGLKVGLSGVWVGGW